MYLHTEPFNSVHTTHSYMYVWSSDAKPKKNSSSSTHAHFERHQRQPAHTTTNEWRTARQIEIESFFTSKPFQIVLQFICLTDWMRALIEYMFGADMCVRCVYTTQNPIHGGKCYTCELGSGKLIQWASEWVSACGKIKIRTHQHGTHGCA